MSNHLARRFPLLGSRLPTAAIATLPTPVSRRELSWHGHGQELLLKHDEQSGPDYGGNKVRKLDYLIQRARDKSRSRVATYGAAGSNHALATAIYARQAGFDCTCLLTHQPVKPGIARTLLAHQQLGSEVLHLGGARRERLATQRKALQGRNVFLIPIGGTCWLGNLGFVNAALELASQIERKDIPCPRQVYVALGSMGTVVGLAIGFALANLDIEIHGIRVTQSWLANPAAIERLTHKTATLMHAFDPHIPPDLARKTRIVCRDEFVGDGYGRSNPATERAIEFAHDALALQLESTYTGKAMAGLLHDIRAGVADKPLFWNTYNSVPLELSAALEPDFKLLPREFARYFE